jgi:hypothetical protein
VTIFWKSLFLREVFIEDLLSSIFNRDIGRLFEVRALEAGIVFRQAPERDFSFTGTPVRT